MNQTNMGLTIDSKKIPSIYEKKTYEIRQDAKQQEQTLPSAVVASNVRKAFSFESVKSNFNSLRVKSNKAVDDSLSFESPLVR